MIAVEPGGQALAVAEPAAGGRQLDVVVDAASAPAAARLRPGDLVELDTTEWLGLTVATGVRPVGRADSPGF